MQKFPYVIEVEENKTYYLCSCKQSQKLPFCDGSHKDESKSKGFIPNKFTSQKTGKAYICACEASSTKPFCDGSHKKL